jgi:hypothetical protein
LVFWYAIDNLIYWKGGGIVGFYDNYRARVQSTLSDSEYINEDNKNLVIENFESQPNYYEITKNSDLVTTYKVLIAEENKKDNIIGYKKLISYPYATTQFSIGDYINWGSSIWLLTTLDDQYDYSVGGKIVKTNTDIKWRDDNGVLKSYRGFKNNKVSDTGFSTGNYFYLPNGELVVQVQNNVDTNTIAINRRFIIDGKAYRVNFIHPIEGLLEFYLETDVIRDSDDLVNNIADNNELVYTLEINQTDFNNTVGYISTLSATVKLNGSIVPESVTWSSSDDEIVNITSDGTIELLAEGSAVITCQMSDNSDVFDTITITVVSSTTSVEEIRISPAVNIILQGETQVYTVYKYINDIQQPDTFTITTSGVAASKYVITIINGNSFSIKNVQQDSNVLTVRCTDDIDGSFETIEIILGGLF